MNKAKLKTYAPQARRDFIQMVRQRADLLGLTKTAVVQPQVTGEVAVIEGRPYPKIYADLHKRLAGKIKAEGLEQFIEHVAYSWFNRLAALRFMEVNDFLPHGFRVLSNREAGKNEPEILTHAAETDLPGLDREKVIGLKLAGNKDAELYRMILIAQCNELHRAMPFLFERINNETEILLPDNLLATDSVIRKMVTVIDEEDWSEVEIIGWLYQFYISEKKDGVIGKTVKSEDIPAATQLFTPNWIVKYMTQNSLGRLWLEANPHSQLARNMEFYIKPMSQPSASADGLNADSLDAKLYPPAHAGGSALNPEEIKVLDPACGSGHILVEAYELLKLIYTERGYSSRDIPLLILEKNLFGLDIDERAAQMASFALLMKARRDDRRIFERLNSRAEGKGKQIPNVLPVPDSSQLPHSAREIAEMLFSREEQTSPAISIRDSNFLFSEMQTQPSLTLAATDQSKIQNPKSKIEVSETNVIDLMSLFEQGKTLGSLVRVPHGFGAVVDKLEKAVEAKRGQGNFLEQIAARELEPFVRAAKILAQKYDCVIANPPYMGRSGMNEELKAFAAKNFPNSKADLFAMFIERNFELAKKDGYNSLVTMQSWLCLSSYESLRESLLNEKTITDLTQIGYNSFPSLNSKIAQAVVFTVLNKHISNFNGVYINLNDSPQSADKEIIFRKSPKIYVLNQEDFKKIPGSPIAYWVSDKMRDAFAKNEKIGNIVEPREGMTTGDNEKYTKFWHEINLTKIGFNKSSRQEAVRSEKKWFPYSKGGEFRKWFGNNRYVVNWEKDGFALQTTKHSSGRIWAHNFNLDYIFKPSVNWSKINSTSFSVRYSDEGFLFDTGSSAISTTSDIRYLITGFLCTDLAFRLIRILTSTVNFQPGDIASLPLNINENLKSKALVIVKEAIEIARADWDSSETSWDFKRLPMIELMNEAHSQGIGRDSHVNEADSQPNARHSQVNATHSHLNFKDSQLNAAHSHVNEGDSHVNEAHSQLNEAHSQPSGVGSAAFSVETAWKRWKQLCDWRIARMQQLETENNRLFIEAYGLEDELSPEVPLEQITLARADAEKDTRRLLSYFAGCLMGRYSLDETGLIYADAEGRGFDPARYQTFPADDDGIVPITDIEWFPTDAARQFEKFVLAVWGEANQTANLRWIAEQLGGKQSETPTETVRRYFSTAFFKDHLQIYKKRPIYWLFSSGKQKAFECLVYLHRYNEATLPRMRHEYVLPLMSKLTAQIETLESLIEKAETTSEKNKLTKQLEVFRKKQTELASFDEKLRHYSDLRISLDLDDGVKVNYGKFGDLLAEVKQIAVAKE